MELLIQSHITDIEEKRSESFHLLTDWVDNGANIDERMVDWNIDKQEEWSI